MPSNDVDGQPEKSGRNHAGRWTRGHSGNRRGKPRGTRHPTLAVLDAIGDEGAADALRVVVAAARGGDLTAASLLLKRVWPERRGRPIQITLPAMEAAEDLASGLAMIVAAVGQGALTPEEGQAVAGILETHRRALETINLAQRIAALEGYAARKAVG